MMLANGVQRCMASRITVLIRVYFSFFTPAAGVCGAKGGDGGGGGGGGDLFLYLFFLEPMFCVN